MYQKWGVKPRRPSAAERLSWVVLSRWFDWPDALTFYLLCVKFIRVVTYW